MKVKQRLWSVKKLLGKRDSINLNPAWQRGPAWTAQRRSLLIDSILRDMDVPKIYLFKLKAGDIYDYDAVDGQQRLRAIWEYIAGSAGDGKKKGYPLKSSEALPNINGHAVDGKRYSELHSTLQEKLAAFQIGIGEILDASNDEITALFARLQMGMPLNPAELRNAMLGKTRNLIKLTATSHEFFTHTKLKDARSKHFDFSSHAFAVAAWGTSRNIKAKDLRDLQAEYDKSDMDEVLELSRRVGDALNVVNEVDLKTPFRITRKWIFVDLLILIMQIQEEGRSIDIDKFAKAYNSFENRRRQYTSKTDQLLDASRPDAKSTDSDLYAYSFAFRADGASHSSLEKRNKAIRKFFKNVDVS